MSHFTVLVIGNNPEGQLAPFDENLVVDRYVRYTKQQLIDMGKAHIENYKNGTYARYLADPKKYEKECASNPGHINYLKNEFPNKLTWSDEEIYKYEVGDYEDVGSDGEVYSTYNPKSKWDWYQLGGRWAGSIELKSGAKRKAPNFSHGWAEEEKKKVTGVDMASKKDIANLDDIIPFAILKDGEWVERGQMGWFEMASNEMDEQEWDNKAKELLHALPEDTLISMYDCHI